MSKKINLLAILTGKRSNLSSIKWPNFSTFANLFSFFDAMMMIVKSDKILILYL